LNITQSKEFGWKIDMKKIKMEQLKFWEDVVNKDLERLGKKTRIKVVGRYGYTAIDKLDEQGRVWDTLIAGLTRREALDLLTSIHATLSFD
jgi:muconolactone delta-isomerase